MSREQLDTIDMMINMLRETLDELDERCNNLKELQEFFQSLKDAILNESKEDFLEKLK